VGQFCHTVSETEEWSGQGSGTMKVDNAGPKWSQTFNVIIWKHTNVSYNNHKYTLWAKRRAFHYKAGGIHCKRSVVLKDQTKEC
jgi:hypothetical protein